MPINFMKQLNIELQKYIEQNYMPQLASAGSSDSALAGIVTDGSKAADFNGFESINFEDILGEVGESFHEMLFRKIDESGMSDVDVYKRANINRRLFSKIRSNPAYHPRKQTVLALAIALQLSLNDAIELLASAEYALSPGNKGDLIVKFFIEHEVYDVQAINFALYEYEQPILGS